MAEAMGGGDEAGAGSGVAGGSAGSTCIAHVDTGLKEQLAASMAGAPTPALPALHLVHDGRQPSRA